jgi:hypothetical protein
MFPHRAVAQAMTTEARVAMTVGDRVVPSCLCAEVNGSCSVFVCDERNRSVFVACRTGKLGTKSALANALAFNANTVKTSTGSPDRSHRAPRAADAPAGAAQNVGLDRGLRLSERQTKRRVGGRTREPGKLVVRSRFTDQGALARKPC